MKSTVRTQSATSLPRAPRDDAGSRTTKYLVMMTIRIVCFALMVLVTPYGWYTWLFALGAVFLPYIAVVIANVGEDTKVVAAVTPERVLSGADDQDAPSSHPRLARHHDPGGRGAGGGSSRVSSVTCSRAGCRDHARWRIDWRNPRSTRESDARPGSRATLTATCCAPSSRRVASLSRSRRWSRSSRRRRREAAADLGSLDGVRRHRDRLRDRVRLPLELAVRAQCGAWAELALVAENYDAAPVPVGQLIPSGTTFDASTQKWHPVILRGTYLADEQLLARNRPHGGTSAFEVLVPFRLDDGRVLLVDRGWVPPGAGDGPDSVPAPPAGPVTVVGRLLPGESLPVSGRETAPAGQVPTINLPLVAQRIPDGARLSTDAYVLMMSEDPAAATAPQPLEAPTEDPGPFLSYAIQWILFAVMGFVFIGYVIRTEAVRRREPAEPAPEDEDSASAADDPPASPRAPERRPLFARRPDRDASDEDALLDRTSR